MRKLKVVRIIDRMNIGGPAVHVVLLSACAKFDTVLVSGCVRETEGDMNHFAQRHGVNPVWVPELSREISPVQDVQQLHEEFISKEGVGPEKCIVSNWPSPSIAN